MRLRILWERIKRSRRVIVHRDDLALILSKVDSYRLARPGIFWAVERLCREGKMDRPALFSAMVCGSCGCEWVGIGPLAQVEYECPECHATVSLDDGDSERIQVIGKLRGG